MSAQPDDFHGRLHHIPPSRLDPETAQTSGMRRYAGVSGTTVGSQQLWLGETHVAPGLRSANHHHGESETAIYVLSGSPEFVFLEDGREVRIVTKAGDYVFVPPFVPHREENPDPVVEAVVILARSSQEAIVINLESLQP